MRVRSRCRRRRGRCRRTWSRPTPQLAPGSTSAFDAHADCPRRVWPFELAQARPERRDRGVRVCPPLRRVLAHADDERASRRRSARRPDRRATDRDEVVTNRDDASRERAPGPCRPKRAKPDRVAAVHGTRAAGRASDRACSHRSTPARDHCSSSARHSARTTDAASRSSAASSGSVIGSLRAPPRAEKHGSQRPLRSDALAAVNEQDGSQSRRDARSGAVDRMRPVTGRRRHRGPWRVATVASDVASQRRRHAVRRSHRRAAPPLRVRARSTSGRARTRSTPTSTRSLSRQTTAGSWGSSPTCSSPTARCRRSTCCTCTTACGRHRNRRDADRVLFPERFIAAGEEKTALELPRGYGYRYSPPTAGTSTT